MGERLEVSVSVLLDAAASVDVAIEMASDDMTVVARGLSDGRTGWTDSAQTAYAALLSAWESSDSALTNQVKELARQLQTSAGEYAEAERRAAEKIQSLGNP